MFSALGVDYGANSVRALVVDYPSGHPGVLLDKKNHHLARQKPAA